MEKYIKNVKLNCIKGFACISVVFIHIRFPDLCGQIVTNVSGYAVPIFFMIAGYYAYEKNSAVIKRRLIKIVKIFAGSYILFFLFELAYAFKDHELLLWFEQHFNWKTPIRYICFCTIDFAIPLWYLIAMIEVYIVWLIVIKKGKESTAMRIFPILFVLQILSTSYCETMILDWFWKINFITRGMSWFLMGYYLNTDKSEQLRSMDTYKLVIMSIIGKYSNMST